MSVVEIKSEQFESMLEEHKLFFIDFWAPWCSPCMAFAKVYEAVAEAYPQIVFAKINIDESPELGQVLEIRSIPHLIIFKDKMAIYSESGSMPASRLRELADQAIQVDVT